ncbi:putative non-specific serine/threonine protein kinase [Helianthus annuus]|uniref:Serine/threonine-protein kinase ATM n=1 Tax=Helianthus annuus TaxID=4232 RepID=A0A9K3JLB0_HELAN|nr:putative non-specific serine/threonine protein kinase [Helianthus annuus]KAJ0617747.1 putative non-specific serine/threonine protein kinase [Helianthus annuus]KAJ0776286.1 putative non-specific serine/threonine protein kinase [Helianthus annuus]KAJ0938717.1 putative non-specific serine/threonine protein kinase [Helianthus annuus]KAJ0950673.1 putative non-specific serine/threonine protein kinase [Helianthus annuus]
MVTSRDVHEIVSKLSSDKAKPREEGIKLLNTWLEGERLIEFCRYLGRNTSMLKPHEIPHAETWPFLVKLLTKAIQLEVSASKKRPPKLAFAKTLRIVVQRAEDGKSLHLLSVAKLLFNHIWEILKDVPSFQSEYGIILRHLLAVKHLQFHLRKRVYSSLVLLYMGKVEISLSEQRSYGQANPKEEVFRCILTLHSLLDSPPGDFSDDLREGITKGFIEIFSNLRDEGKVLRKLVECINTYLIRDGPNMGTQSLEIHDAIHQFLFRVWVTTHDRGLKDALVLYARLQLKLARGATDGSALLEQLLDIIGKELDHINTSTTSLPWNDTNRDDKRGTLTNSQSSLLELAAFVFCRACLIPCKAPVTDKRTRRENAVVYLHEQIIKGKWSWNSAFCFLVHDYSSRVKHEYLIYWFEGLSTNFERIMNTATMEHAYDDLLWTLRSLQGLSSVLLSPIYGVDCSGKVEFTNNQNSQLYRGWHTVWNALLRGLPMFSNVTSVADAALILLGNINLCDPLNNFIVAHDAWDLRLFKSSPSESLLRFISGYFSKKGSHGDIRDVLHLRKDLLRTVMGLLNWKERLVFNEHMVVLLPAAVFSLCAGSACFAHCVKGSPLAYLLVDIPVTSDDSPEIQKLEQEGSHDLFDCSVEVLAEVCFDSHAEVAQSLSYQKVRLPHHLRDSLLHEMELNILEVIKSKDIEKMVLSDVLFICALLSNFMYGLYALRLKEEKASFLTETGQYILEMLSHAVSLLEKSSSDIRSGCVGSNVGFDNMDSVSTSLKCFINSPLFTYQECDSTLYNAIIQSITRLLKALAKLYEGFFDDTTNLQSDWSNPDISVQESHSLKGDKTMVLDMELDADDDYKDVDIISTGETSRASPAFNLKLNIISLISNFFSILPVATWDVLFSLTRIESDHRLMECLLLNLCQHPCWSSCQGFSDMVLSLDKMVDMLSDIKLHPTKILAAICGLLQTLKSLNKVRKEKDPASYINSVLSEQGASQVSMELILENNSQSLVPLGDLVNKIAENDQLDWCSRVKIVDCICDFVSLNPQISQTMIEKLLLMLRDPDFRVRFSLARRIGVLFQTWDGHDELFQDILSNFSVKLVVLFKGMLVKANEVLAAGHQPQPMMETIIVTLGHVALHSEKIELEAVFMICVVAAMDSSQRELVGSVLDNLSRQLHYSSRSEYIGELIAPIIFFWVQCGVSLAALVETRELFVLNVEASNFIQYISHWLLPAMILYNDISSLNWVAKVAGQPSAALIRSHFVAIFSICIALHCSKRPGWESATTVLQSSMLSISGISENERDTLIKKHMVSIVSHILSLASRLSEPALPFFSKDTIQRAIQTVVDGFLNMEQSSPSIVVVDKINIFRPDRVFMFILEMHQKITASTHHRHRCNRLSGIEVLVNVLGHRAAAPSTSNYLFNLVGQFIDCGPLQDQCCHIISELLKTLKHNQSKDGFDVLSEQLQFLVSKLVGCCIPPKSDLKNSITQPSEALSLLHQLVVDSDSSLHKHIKELGPFPEFDTFDNIRAFHHGLCHDYSAREHLLEFVRRSSHLPPRLVICSLKALHSIMFSGFQREKNAQQLFGDEFWQYDNEVVHAVWTLVRMASSDATNSFGPFVSDFLSLIGIGDPHRVVFHLPRDSNRMHVCRPLYTDGGSSFSFHMDSGLSEELLIAVMQLLKKYLMDESVEIIEMASQALRGILSTERGHRALLSLNSYERSILEVHSKGVNAELVQKSLVDLERKFNGQDISVEKSGTWVTSGKTFETWICQLVYALIYFCDDTILRLCQDIVLLKAEVAELLLSNVMVNLAKRKNVDIDLCKLISVKVMEEIVIESNNLTRSVQVILDALNELRLCHVMEKAASGSSKTEGAKHTKSSGYSSRSRNTPHKSKDHTVTSTQPPASTLAWEKVYWLPIDYLVVAKSAISCGSYFTAVLYVEHWCQEHFNCLTLGSPDFSHLEMLPHHIEILVSAVTQINEPDSLYGIIQSHKLTSQIITFEHEGNWSKALEYYDLQVRSEASIPLSSSKSEDEMRQRKPHKGVIKALQQIGCTHVLDMYSQGLMYRKGRIQDDLEFNELQFEAAWRAGNWDFSVLYTSSNSPNPNQQIRHNHFNQKLHSCLRAFQEGDINEFNLNLKESKQLLFSIYHASEESTEYIYSTIVKLQIFCHLGLAWSLRWASLDGKKDNQTEGDKMLSGPFTPNMDQLSWLNTEWSCILNRAQLHMNLLEPFIAFRKVMLQILSCKDCTVQHLLESASILRKGYRFSHAAAALHELKFFYIGIGGEDSKVYWLGRVEEAKLLRAQGQHEMAVNLAKYISENCKVNEEAADVYRLVGKWLAETRSSNSRTILEKYLKNAVSLANDNQATDKKSIARKAQTHFHLAHYADALFRNYEERLTSNEWQAAMRLRKHKTKELEALQRRFKNSSKGEKADYLVKIQELHKQLAMDKEEAEKLQQDRDNFLSIALEGYKRCLVIGDKYDVRVVFRLVSLWFSLCTRQIVVDGMFSTIKEVQSYKFIPLVYQIASRLGSSKDSQGPNTFQFALVSLLKKMAIDHPYHTIFQLLALANGDRVKDKQRSRNSFVVDMDKKYAAESLLKELSSHHGAVIRQMKQMVEIYIRLAELETKREDTNKKIALPREIRSVRQLELVPVVTSSFPVDPSCQYSEGSFPHFKGLSDSVTIMNGINAPKVVECLGSDGKRYRQLAKSGNDDLRQDAVMEQFFALVNTFLQNHRDTWKRRLGIRTYKVVPFTPSAGVLEWVNGTLPLGEYLTGSSRSGGAHGRYGLGDWSFPKCRQHMATENNKRKAFQEVCDNFRPVMHHFFLERFLHPADWFEKRLAYTRSVAASSMVGYIVGLGDRHSMNILIDQATAEVVHIDLGVAFEQGLMLKTPERVPFRLTRDIIDGMGVTGVEGVFRRCCEENLSVMRTNKEALLTIIEVFIHDPLYKWALSPLKALERQKETDDDLETSLEDSENEYEGNKDAARALLRVKQKLDGYEEGEMRSVHGQVQQLIQDAIDPDRLCHMFPGWASWL